MGIKFSDGVEINFFGYKFAGFKNSTENTIIRQDITINGRQYYNIPMTYTKTNASMSFLSYKKEATSLSINYKPVYTKYRDCFDFEISKDYKLLNFKVGTTLNTKWQPLTQ